LLWPGITGGQQVACTCRTIEPSICQGIVSCSKCGYALYRTSTRSSARKIYYYRCLEEIRHYLCGEPFANWKDSARSFAAAKTLEPKDCKTYLRTLLYPGRFCYSWMTGLMGSNDDAAVLLTEKPWRGSTSA
jgi:hypothetical protein